MIVIDADTVNDLLDWRTQIEALRAGHRVSSPAARPAIDDMLVKDAGNAVLIRAAWAPGGPESPGALGLKAVTVFPDNPGKDPPLPAVQGQFLLFDGETGAVSAVIDGAAITAWKTAGDSALGADLLARQDVKILSMVGAGAMSEPLVRAHLAVRPGIERIIVANRTRDRAARLAGRLMDTGRPVELALKIDEAVAEGDIVCVATMTREPVVRGALLKPGAHLDLVGAYTPDMREADDDVFRRGRLFVDARETTVHEIGELMIPIAAGVIGETDVLGDLFDLVPGTVGRASADEITVFKNGGGAHLDLMTAGAIHSAWVRRHQL
jgi:ornithine cyclodeaminase/alanine dehydrogenase-like protein (mu-crystallin family)